jgi:hypothetical protein
MFKFSLAAYSLNEIARAFWTKKADHSEFLAFLLLIGGFKAWLGPEYI